MTRWEVRQERDAWAVVKVNADGTITYPRARWVGISCIDAQVIAAELNDAYRLGQEHTQEVWYQTTLGN